MIDVAVLDSGISVGYFDNIHLINSSIDFTNPNEEKNENKTEDILTHGTVCASIIRNYAPDVMIHNVKVISNEQCELSNLITAIDYCITKKIKVLNISLGINCFYDNGYLKAIVEKAISNNHIIIASIHKAGITTYPACYQKVISVGVNEGLHLRKNMIAVNRDPKLLIDVLACGIQRLYKDNKMAFVTKNEPSYATAVVTSMVCNILSDHDRNISFDSVMKLLVEKSSF